MSKLPRESNKECTYYVRGMHCAACEVLIEKKLLKEEGVSFADASTKDGSVRIEYAEEAPNTETLNKLFKKAGYQFSEQKIEEKEPPLFRLEKNRVYINNQKFKNLLVTSTISLLLIAGFIALNKYGITSWMVVTTGSALPAFFIFGLLAGMSSCAALVGGLVLSMSKQWSEIYSTENSFTKLQPHILFNLGRLLSYAILGAALGALGSTFKLSLTLSAVVTIAVSALMIGIALQMLGIKAFRKFHIVMPKSFTKYAADETNFKAKYMPFFMGALTFFLPCGFTITAQGIALASGSPIQGALIMFSFALGTLPSLLLIGISSTEFLKKPHISNLFLKTAGILILFFAFFNINSQLNVLGITSLSDLNLPTTATVSAENGFTPLVEGKQVIKMDAFAYGYQPNYFKVRPNIPIRFEITDKGTSGCTNAVISRNLFDGEISLTPGETSIKEFLPTKEGRYKFSCWMGMVSGVIDVTTSSDVSETPTNTTNIGNVAPSETLGCGGNTGTCSGGCGGGCGNPTCLYAK